MDIEEQARAEGWRPKEEFDGPEGNWVDAETFVKRGQEMAPILSAKNKRLMEEIEALKSEVKQIRTTSTEFKKLADKSIEKSRKERDEAIAALEKQRAQAITDGDGVKVTQTEKQIKQLEAENVSEEKQTSQSQWNERSVQWAKDNSWYLSNSPEYDEEKKIYADGVSDIIMSQLPHLQHDPDSYFKELTRRVDERFAERNENRERQTVESRGGNKSVKSGERTFSDLPEEAKAGFEQMKFLHPDLTEEGYMKYYKE